MVEVQSISKVRWKENSESLVHQQPQTLSFNKHYSIRYRFVSDAKPRRLFIGRASELHVGRLALKELGMWVLYKPTLWLSGTRNLRVHISYRLYIVFPPKTHDTRVGHLLSMFGVVVTMMNFPRTHSKQCLSEMNASHQSSTTALVHKSLARPSIY